ncbi:MAG: hypothetical protein TREMPRED_003898 [Tremellales sp. Tagirdzhanova-0007]|nr:MAG: hypothetical protein TREMPRED_003898 [Tremellales sp. Tagirdzhanova-0007]
MATVHPSRLGLVPGSLSATKPPLSASREEELRQKLSARRHEERGRAPVNDKRESHAESGSREERTHDDTSHRTRGYEKSSYHDDRRNEEGRNNGRDLRDNRSSRSPSRRDYDSKTHSYPRDKSPQADGHRRPSPTYRPYESLPPPQDSPGHHVGPRTHRSEGAGVDVKKEKSDIRRGFEAAPPPPWRDGGSSGWQDGPPRGGYGGPLDFEKRRLEREKIPLSIWPASPKQPFRDEDELEADRKALKRKSKKSGKSSKHSKRRSKRYYSDSDDTASETDSDEERRRRQRRKEREKRRKYSDDEVEETTHARRSKSIDEKRSDKDLADQWVEKGGEVVLVPKDEDFGRIEHPPVLFGEEDYDDEEVGPHLPVELGGRERLDRSAFTNLLRGEGEAMAAFVASGQRIPRRGEIGLESDQITAFEGMGYVMSGSRHRRMNAVRMRKENQVINAEEKRAILNLQREEKQKKEGMIISQFRQMMDESLIHQGLQKP